ncbi:sulfotransferase domain-containing protein [Cyanobacterium aponinum FACHB-4101]|nr:sulfotransferase domain-containing protein [Cyanobacterium aponinum FACHB-4101]
MKEQYRQIIICGIPRSGTSLTFNLLNTLVLNMVAKYPQNKQIKNNNDNKFGISKEISGIHFLYKKGNFITKQPDDIFNMSKFQQRNFLKKKILVLILYRDFRDILISKHQWGEDEYYLNYEYKNTLKGGRDFKKGLKHYIFQIKQLRKKAKGENVSIEFLAYEEIVSNPDVLVDILNQYGFPNLGSGYWQGQTRKNVYSSEEIASGKIKPHKSKWRNPEYAERIISEFDQHECLFQELIDFGYEKDNHWFDQLKQ